MAREDSSAGENQSRFARGWERADGYHLVDTIMVPVSLYDEIDLRKIRATAGNDSDRKSAAIIPSCRPEKKNLAYKAALLI